MKPTMQTDYKQQLSVRLCQCLSRDQRNMASSFLSFSLLFITVYTADGFMEFVVARCEFNSTELEDVRYIYSMYYNKLEYARFDSSVGKFVGYTEFGVKNADYWNNDPSQLGLRLHERETYCLGNVKIDYNYALTKSGELVFETSFKPR
ncbi:H-2 class II histocompatibility antigen%2C E-S beta chain-like isoform X1 [Scomber scombrus]|uniref:H-2 class II histocompatibility antigen, E-S beta chain-like isoform X1 n=2 Tax=Scomber scombrus TaxID=13677 RepID=A0AAV1QFS2_SCOSC